MFYNVVLVSAIQRSGPAIHILPCVCTHAQSLSHVQLSATPWTAALQAPLSIDFPGKNTGVGCQFLLQGNLPDPGIEPGSPVLQADSLQTDLQGKPYDDVLCI